MKGKKLERKIKRDSACIDRKNIFWIYASPAGTFLSSGKVSLEAR
jgi:hypothetical protein